MLDKSNSNNGIDIPK